MYECEYFMLCIVCRASTRIYLSASATLLLDTNQLVRGVVRLISRCALESLEWRV